jgi:hypothetical protein
MKKLILIAAGVFIHISAFAEPVTQKSAEAVSNFANVSNVFMILEIVLVSAFILFPIYSMSRAVNVLAKKISEK